MIQIKNTLASQHFPLLCKPFGDVSDMGDIFSFPLCRWTGCSKSSAPFLPLVSFALEVIIAIHFTVF